MGKVCDSSPVLSALPALNFYLKDGLSIVVRAAEHACDDASKRILSPQDIVCKCFL